MERRNINTVGTIFNDFLGLYTGERPVGIRELIQKYDKHPVLMGLLSNVDSIIYVDVKKAMYEIYPLYKKYRHGEKSAGRKGYNKESLEESGIYQGIVNKIK